MSSVLTAIRRVGFSIREVWDRLRLTGAGEGPLLRPYPWEQAYPDGVAWDFDLAARPVHAILEDSVRAHGDKPCISFLGKRYSYADIGSAVDKAARTFQDIGVGPGVRVGLFLPNSHYFVICYHAVLKAGRTVVNFNPLYAEREIERQIRDSGVKTIVTLNLKTLYRKVSHRLDDDTLDRLIVCSMSAALPLPKKAVFAVLKRREIQKLPADDRHLKFDAFINNQGNPDPVKIDPGRDVAVLQYTGGTTGVPKGAKLTHANLYANTRQTDAWAPAMVPGAEKILGVLPLFHVFGMTGVMNAGLAIGAELILLPHFRLAEVLSVIDKEKPTLFFGVPTIFSAINGAKDRDKYDLSSLKFCISGGAPLPKEVKRVFEEATDCSLVEGYGLTEAGPVVSINPIGGINKPGSAGLPIPGTVVSIVSLDDPTRTLPIGEKGEVCVRGPQVMAGYWDNDEDTLSVLAEGVLRTGDVGYLDEDGYLFLIDRIKDLIITGGYNVYPRMVEEAIYLHPEVVETAVCGVPHAHHGEMVKAFVTLKPGETLSAGELRRFLKEKLAPFEVPRRVEFIDAIPKTIVGKPLRRELVRREKKRWRGARQKSQGKDPA